MAESPKTPAIRTPGRTARRRLVVLAAVVATASLLSACASAYPTHSQSSRSSGPTPPPPPKPVNNVACTTLLSSWNSVMTSLGAGPLDPNGWDAASAPAAFPLPDGDGHATVRASCGTKDSTGTSIVLSHYALDNSGDWDTAYYYAIKFADWSGPGANSSQNVGAWRSWQFSKSGPGNQSLSVWILASGSDMFVVDSVKGVNAPSGGSTGQITVIATFIGTTTACSDADVVISGPNGFSDEGKSGADGTVVFRKLAKGDYQLTGGGGGSAHPVVNGAGVASATVTVTGGDNETVQFGCG